MDNKEVKLTKTEAIITEATVSAIDEFAKAAIMEAVLSTIKDTGYVTLEESQLIENFVYKVVTEAAEDFVPSEDEIEEMIKKLEALGYTVETPAGEAKEGEGEEGGEGSEGGENEGSEGEGEGEGEGVQTESTSLADAIAKKLEIL